MELAIGYVSFYLGQNIYETMAILVHSSSYGPARLSYLGNQIFEQAPHAIEKYSLLFIVTTL